MEQSEVPADLPELAWVAGPAQRLRTTGSQALGHLRYCWIPWELRTESGPKIGFWLRAEAKRTGRRALWLGPSRRRVLSCLLGHLGLGWLAAMAGSAGRPPA